MNKTVDKNKSALAERIIADILKDQDMLSKDVLGKLKLMGVSERTANKAKNKLGVRSYRKNGVWYWRLETVIVGE